MNILGAGPAGLILGYLLDADVYGYEIGGQMRGFCKGPRILECDEDSIWLLNKLGLYREPRTFNVAYMTKRGLRSSLELVEEEREEYYRKTRGSEADMPASIMSGGKSHILGWDINELGLIDKLLASVNTKKARVVFLSFMDNEVQLSNGMTLTLTECINTINLKVLLSSCINWLPLDIFYLTEEAGKIVKPVSNVDALDLRSYDTTFIRVDNPSGHEIHRSFDYIYFTDPRMPMNRLTMTELKGDNPYVIYECRGDRFEATVDYLESLEIEIGLVETIRHCQLINSYNILEIGYDNHHYSDNRLKMCGRYAQWNHGIKLNDVIRRGREYAESLGR